MAKLGDAFPAHTRRALIEKQLTPGCVVRITVKFTEITKPKLLVLVADDDPDYCWFIINSEINAYVRMRPHLYQCQVNIDATAHDFLKRTLALPVTSYPPVSDTVFPVAARAG